MEYGLIGEKLRHSFSPEIHSKIGDYRYELTELSAGELPEFFSKRDFKGINVTVPYKEKVIPCLDFLSPEAESIGSVNTVINCGGKLTGYNTDYFGLMSLIEDSGISLHDKKVLILGSGGTAKTAKAVSADLGAKEILTVGRSGNGDITYSEAFEKHSGTDIIINATPCGMWPNIDETPVDIKKFGKLSGVIDVIYNPLNTKLLCKAKELDIPTAGGLYMLISQAVKAAELFGFSSKLTAEELYRKVLREKRNAVLIGMPSSGKSTVGKSLADKTEREFFDSDTEIEKSAGKSISDIFTESGEEFFRAEESRIITEKLSLLSGAVIATGGGAVLNENNMRLLSQNGKVYFLDRPKELLIPTADRPTASDREKISALYESRRAFYLKYADVVVDGSKTVEEISDFIKEDLAE